MKRPEYPAFFIFNDFFKGQRLAGFRILFTSTMYSLLSEEVDNSRTNSEGY